LQIVRAKTLIIRIRKQKTDRTTHNKIEIAIEIDTAKIIAITIRTAIDK